VTVVLLVLVGALVGGWLRGGSLYALSRLSLQWWPLVFLALGVQALGAFADPLGLPEPQVWYVIGMVSSALLISVFVVRNRALVGVPLIAAGFLLNAVVIAANGAMPVSEEAADRAGVGITALITGDDAKHELLTDDTRLHLLADVIPVPLPTERGSNVLSFGDVVLAAGIGVLVLNGMLLREPLPVRRRRYLDTEPRSA
jgi:hypothetical protein